MGLIVGFVGSNNSGQNGGMNDDKGKDCNYLGLGDYTEKVGVGGSTPSLATIILKNLDESPVPLQSALSPHLGRGVRRPTHTSMSLKNLS